jgi:hypothetical protein
MYQVQMQFIPGNDQIWVAQLNPGDPIYDFEIEADAVAKAAELQAADPSGRQYRAQALIVVEETPIVEETPAEEVPTEEPIV